MYKSRLDDELVEDEEYKKFLKNLDAYYEQPLQGKIEITTSRKDAPIALEEEKDFDLEKYALSAAEF